MYFFINNTRCLFFCANDEVGREERVGLAVQVIRIGDFMHRVDGQSTADYGVQRVRECPVVVVECHVVVVAMKVDIEFVERGVVIEWSVLWVVHVVPHEMPVPEARMTFRNDEDTAFPEGRTYMVQNLDKFLLSRQANKNK